MAAQEPIALRPTFQPRLDRSDVAASYTLQGISWKTVVRESGCWEWTGRRSEDGYGVVVIGGRTYRVTRIVYQLCNADLSDELLICHDCDNPPCCNPQHLFVGTHLTNAQDAVAKGRINPRSLAHGKLTVEHVRAIRRRAGSCAKEVVTPLAAEYGVSASAIIDIVRRNTWKSVS